MRDSARPAEQAKGANVRVVHMGGSVIDTVYFLLFCLRDSAIDSINQNRMASVTRVQRTFVPSLARCALSSLLPVLNIHKTLQLILVGHPQVRWQVFVEIAYFGYRRVVLDHGGSPETALEVLGTCADRRGIVRRLEQRALQPFERG